jgi:hypothetical protein
MFRGTRWLQVLDILAVTESQRAATFEFGLSPVDSLSSKPELLGCADVGEIVISPKSQRS